MILGNASALMAAGLWAVASVLFTGEGKRTRPVVMNLVKSAGALVLFLLLLPVAASVEGETARGLLSPSAHAAATMSSAFREQAVGWLLLSGLIGIGVGDTFYFVALGRIGVRRTMALGLLAPVFAAVLAALAGQPLPGLLAAAGIAFVLAGVYLVIRVTPLGNGASSAARAGTIDEPSPSPGRPRLGAVLGILSALCQAVGIVLTKDAIEVTGVLPASALRLGGGILGLVGLEILRGRGRGLVGDAIRGFARRRLLLAAFLGTFVAFFLFQLSIRLGSPPVTAALVGTAPLFAAPLAARYLREHLPAAALWGTLLAVAGVALIAW